MPKIKINGKEVDVPAGRTVLQASLDAGAFVPHYCWHPGLTPAGNCRMCILKVSNSKKLEASCMYPCSEGLEVTTEGPEVAKGRQDVLEFLLINHPLDCPICDKAGECALQDYTYTYRGGLSRFQEPKNIRHTKDLGPNIKIWGNRCIVCTRCVRFSDEISKTGELCVVNRGDRSVVDTFPGIPIDNPMSLNTVDICPVGALIDKNFLYQARVWFAKETDTVCAGCSRGCNGRVTALDNDVKRFVARPNADVNKYWMCDEGRLDTKYVSGPKRLKTARGSARELAAAARTVAQKHGPESVALVVSAFQTIEEIHLFKKLAAALGKGPIGVITRTKGAPQVFGDGFTIEPDKTPNRAFAEIALGRSVLASGLDPIVARIKAGHVKGLVVVNGLPGFEPPAALVDVAGSLDFLGVIDIESGPLVSKAHVALPGAVWAEKDGCFMNVDHRVQRIRPAVLPPAAARPEAELLQQALIELGVGERVLSAEGVFKDAARTYPELAGLDYAKVGLLGAAPARPVAAEVAR